MRTVADCEALGAYPAPDVFAQPPAEGESAAERWVGPHSGPVLMGASLRPEGVDDGLNSISERRWCGHDQAGMAADEPRRLHLTET